MLRDMYSHEDDFPMNRRGLKRSQLVATGVAGLISFIFIVTLVAPGSTTQVVTTPVVSSNNNSNTFRPTDAADNIENPEPYVHPSGLFQSYRPGISQWQLLTNSSAAVEGPRGQVVDARFRGNQSCAVIHLLAEAGGDYESVEELNNAMSSSYFADAWGQYGTWNLRSRELQEDRVIAEFDLRQPPDFSAQCPDSYRARTVSWVSNGIAQHVRMVVRSDDTESLARIESLVVPSFIVYPYNASALGSTSWRAQADTDLAHFFIMPTGFRQDTTLSTEDRTIYIGTIGSSNATLAVETIAGLTLEDQAAAESWLTSFIPSSAEILSSDTVLQPYASGFLFSYQFTDSEGLVTSSAASLLNDGEGSIHFLELQVTGTTSDFIDPEAEVDFVTDQASDIVRSFTIMIPSF